MTEGLEILVEKQKTNFSVIMTFYVLLEDYKNSLTQNAQYDGLLAREIRAGYNKIAQEYGKKDFANSYVQRHTKTDDFFIERNSRYKIRPELLDGISERIASKLLLKIKTDYDNHLETRYEVVISIEDLKQKDLGSEELKNELDGLMRTDGFNKGQLFEIISFSILHEYFKTFGFTLNRFSTTFSNDGGIDFIAQDCVYQVTSSPTTKKLESDLMKLPEIKRVFVLPATTQNNLDLLLNHELVNGVITADDLLNQFFPRLFDMNLTGQMFDTIIFEVNREI